MERSLGAWFSPSLGREMAYARFGSAGKPLVLFPTAAGDALECERAGLVDAIAGLVRARRIRLYCVGSVTGESWMDPAVPPPEKAARQACFDAYMATEVVPMIRHECGDPAIRVMTAGASVGAYNAVTFTAKHPELSWLAVAMSGTYDFDRFVGDWRGEDYYYNQPLYFLPQLADPVVLGWLHRSFFLLATGQGKHEAPAETARLAEVLARKGIPHHVETWGYDVDHDWPTWRTMLPLFLDRF